MDAAQKKTVIEAHAKHEGDTGSSEVQVALLLPALKGPHRAPQGTQRRTSTPLPWPAQVGQRRNLLNYLKSKDIQRYRALIEKLGLRK